MLIPTKTGGNIKIYFWTEHFLPPWYRKGITDFIRNEFKGLFDEFNTYRTTTI